MSIKSDLHDISTELLGHAAKNGASFYNVWCKNMILGENYIHQMLQRPPTT